MEQTIFTTFFLVFGLFYFSYGLVVNVDDLIVEIINGAINCSGTICPEEANRCVATKENDPNDYKNVIVTRTCYMDTNNELSKTVSLEYLEIYKKVNATIDANLDGTTRISNFVEITNIVGGPC